MQNGPEFLVVIPWQDYERVVEHILGMADVLSNGIIAQFPKKF